MARNQSSILPPPSMNASDHCLFTTSPGVNVTAFRDGTHEQGRLFVLAWCSVVSVLCVAGVLTNVLVLVILQKFPKHCEEVGRLIGHLLACNLVLCLFVMPMTIHRIISVSSPSNELGCKSCRYQHVLLVAFNSMVNWSEGMLACNRLVAILFPFRFHTFINRDAGQYTALAACWALTLFYTVPPSFSLLGECKVYTNAVVHDAVSVSSGSWPTAWHFNV